MGPRQGPGYPEEAWRRLPNGREGVPWTRMSSSLTISTPTASRASTPSADRMLFVAYTMRDDVVRIISARGAEPHEKRKYHEI
jgi:hypothetical protein